MKPAIIINILILMLIGLAGYGITHYMNAQKPNVIVQPKAPVENLSVATLSPDFEFTDLRKNTHNLKNFEGKIVILNFWATWCAPCIKEFPNLIKIAKEYPEDVVLIALSSDIDQAKIQQFLEKYQFNIENQSNIYVALDTENVTQNTFQTFKLPETILIDKLLYMRKKLIGSDWDLDYLKAEIEKLL